MTKNVWHFYYLNSKNWSFYTLHETNHSVKLSKIVVTFKPQMQFWCPSRFKLLCVALLKHQQNCCVLGSNLKKWDQHSWDLALFGKKTQQKGVVWNFTKWWQTKKFDHLGRIMWSTRFSLCGQTSFCPSPYHGIWNNPWKIISSSFFLSQRFKF